MSRLTTTSLAAALALGLASVANSQTIVGSAHDFTGKAWNTTGEICIVCHTTHNTNASVSDAPLWNHALTAATFTLYTSSTLQAVPGQPTASSKLCLSCHDGTVALDNFSGKTTGTTFITGADLLGTSLANDHPISFTYNTALATADGSLKDPSTALGIGTKTIAASMLIGGQLQCASCHDVHRSYTFSKLLVKSNAASGLCLTCHTK